MPKKKMTSTPSNPDPEPVPEELDPTATDLPGAIARVKERQGEESDAPRRPGRPRGSKSKKRGPGRPRKDESPFDREPVEVTETDIVGAGYLGGVVWKLLADATGRVRALDATEERALGEALAPVLAKWLPGIEDWPEIGLALVVVGLYQKTKIPKVFEIVAPEPGELDARDDR